MNLVPWAARILLYLLVALMALYAVILMWWQLMVLKGKAMPNPDGSLDSYHEQKSHYGIALADLFISGPTILIGAGLILVGSRWGYYIMALACYWFFWANIMTTATSLRFEKPRITFMWFITFPFGSLLGVAYIVWTFVYFDAIYCQ